MSYQTKSLVARLRYIGSYRINLLIGDRLIVETESVEQLLKIHEAQVLTYMKLATVSVGLLINFNVDVLRKGVRRFVL